MTKKFYESMRSQDIRDAQQVLRQARNHRQSGGYHADLMRVVRLHIDAVRYASKRLEAYT